MRILSLLASLILFASIPSAAQWLDSTNKFNDSLHMPVATTKGDQARTLVIKSEDGGYFLLWEDTRNSATKMTDIYAQKFDKDGKRLWAVDGVPVATSELNEQIRVNSNADYRRFSVAAPDGNGGLYACWNYTTRIGSYDYYGVAVQHLHADGSRVFGDGGTVTGAPSPTNSRQCSNPQLVPDGKGGFFIAYVTSGLGGGIADVFAYCYKDEGGTLRSYGGGQMDEYGKQLTTGAACGIQYYVSNAYDATVQNFMLYPDQQGGCNVVMALATNSQELYVGYNRLARIKKDCHTTVLRRAGGEGPEVTRTFEYDYKKDSVVRIYNYKTYTYTVTCHPENHPEDISVVSNTKIENNGLGYLPLNLDPKFFIDLPQGVILPTGGNINAEMISTTERALDGKGGLTPYHLHGYYRLNEIYDSLPYELCSDMDHPYQAYRPTLPDNAIPTDTLLAGPDSLISHTLLGQDNYTMNGSGNKVWLSTRGSELNLPTSVYLQELKLVSAGAKKYTFVINTSDKQGVKIGQEVYTNFTGTQVLYNTPSIATDDNGHGLFYVQESDRFARVSPIEEGGKLTWGAMGRPVGGGYWGGSFISSHNPFAVLSDDGKGLLAWDNNRNTGDINSAENVWMERISKVFTPAYQPPLPTLKLLGTQISESVPGYLSGSTNTWSTMQVPVYDGVSGAGLNGATPILSILDNYPLGTVYLKIFENSGVPRVTDGKPYLNRNYTIVVDNNPHGSGNIPIRFYIPQAEFDGLKAADPSIANPGDLAIIKQPNDSYSNPLPQTYVPVAGEEIVPLTGWGAIDGGYYIQFIAKGFSNFFIAKGTVPLPLKWLDVTGRFTDPTATAITWTVTEENNIKGYTVQYSADGVTFTDGCTTGSTNSGVTTSYSCTTSLPSPGAYFFRVRQEDLDGKSTYSKVIELMEPDVINVFTVSPNPTSDAAYLRIPGTSTVKQLTLLSTNGKVLWQSAGAQSGTVTIPMAQLAAGVYHLRVMGDKEVHVLKIIKKQ